MQIDVNLYDELKHDRFKAIALRQPFASEYVEPYRTDADGMVWGKRCIEVRTKNTHYRGDVMICALERPYIPEMPHGCILGIAELYDCIPVEQLTPEQWALTSVARYRWGQMRGSYGYCFRNPRRVIELPCLCGVNIHNIVYEKGDIVEYPRSVVIDDKGWQMINAVKHKK